MEADCLMLDKAQQSSISENLNILMKLNNKTETKIAQDLNIPVMTVRRLISGETTDPRISTLKTLADYFNVSIDALIGVNKLTMQEIKNPSRPILIPMFDWNNVHRISSVDLSTWPSWIPVTLRNHEQMSDGTFALESRPSMYPPFQPGTIFILDPSLTPSDGDLVLVNLKEENDLTLRELSIDPPDRYLRSLSQETKALQFSKDQHEILAVVLLTLFYNRKI